MADTLTSTGVVNQSDPAIGVVTISGTADLEFSKRVRGVYVGTAGDLKADFADGSTGTLVGLLAGVVYPFCIVKVYDTGTTMAGHALV